MLEQYTPLREELAKDCKSLRALFGAIHTTNGKIDNELLDTILGIPLSKGWEFSPFPGNFGADYIYEGTPYRIVRRILQTLKPQGTDTVVDIGSGYGRLCLYGALVSDAKFTGVDIVPHRIRTANASKEMLHIPNASFIETDINDFDLSSGNIFYMYNPFYPWGYRNQKEVERNLAALGQEKPITVVTLSMKNVFAFNPRDTFTSVSKIGTTAGALEVFKSKLG